MKLWGFIFALLMLTCIGKINAQGLDNAIGFRGGLSNGITYQYFYQSMKDVKFLLSLRDQGMQLTAIIEQYEPVMISYHDQFFMYYGAGFHMGYVHPLHWTELTNHPQMVERFSAPKAVAGINGIIGMEYRIASVPLAFGADYKPFMEFFGERFFKLRLIDFALTLKYQF